MIRLLQFLAVLFLVRYIWRAIQGVLGAVETKSVNSGSGRDSRMVYRGQMVRDPVCGVYVPEQGALTERQDGKVLHFCSDACRDAFRTGKVKVS